MTDQTIQDIVADIAAQAGTSENPPELRAAMIAFAQEHQTPILHFRIYALAMAAGLLKQLSPDMADREVCERVMATELVSAAAFVIKAMKARIGQATSPARFALVAYETAAWMDGLTGWDDAAAAYAQMIDDPSVETEAQSLVAAYDRLRDSPVDLMLWCPSCGVQHVDEPQPEKAWTNPPHRTHECQKCGHRWRPYEVATNGVLCLRPSPAPKADAA